MSTEPSTPFPLGGEDGTQTDLRVRFYGSAAGGGPLTNEHVRMYLADCCQFLRQLVMITSGVLESVGLGQVRKIVAAEIPVPDDVIGEDGQRAKPAQGAEPGRDHRKEPRGRKHPVITLIQMALQGVRLLLRITCGTHPNAHGKETLEQKETREELQEQERTFKNLLNGRV